MYTYSRFHFKGLSEFQSLLNTSTWKHSSALKEIISFVESTSNDFSELTFTIYAGFYHRNLLILQTEWCVTLGWWLCFLFSLYILLKRTPCGIYLAVYLVNHP